MEIIKPPIQLHFLSIICSLLLLVQYLTTVDLSKKEEDEWIRKHGTNQSTSGKWKELLELQDNIPLLQGLCTQCHSKAYNESRVRVTEAYVSDWLLTFSHNKIEPISATMAMYTTAEQRVDPDQKIPYHYFTKGTRPDCVLYVKETKIGFRFWKQVCAIRLPETEDRDVSEDEYPAYDEPIDDTFPGF